MHVHSQYSQSHVEFGPPLKVIDEMANACGLDFTAVTDHSYDLSCAMDDYLTVVHGVPAAILSIAMDNHPGSVHEGS